MILLIASALALMGALAYWSKLRHAIHEAPQLHKQFRSDDRELEIVQNDPVQADLLAQPEQTGGTVVSVIVPAYNEVENIQDCLTSILDSTVLSAEALDVWVVDDQSTDETFAIAHSLQQQRQDPRLKVLAGQPKPEGEVWVGKNWACTQAAEQSKGKFLLFLDADVRLKSGAIETALYAAQQEEIDLLSCGPAIICGCLAEWLVQPLIISTILVGFNFQAVNAPETETAFAAGPFMFFRRSAYEKIGGHRAVAGEVVEDVELSRRVKSSGLKLRYLLGSELAAVRMYRSWNALWEGWTKNLYAGSGRNLGAMLSFIALILLVCTVPWAVLLVALVKFLWVGLSIREGLAIALSVITIGLQYDVRRRSATVSQIPPRYWWLTGVGGALVGAIALGSIIKTETGWGWTWRGRSLKQI
ncbi:glycosyltransferase family 2 protein [Leptolyngbya sp. FACHB-671]|uniref:glycosyltransferase n=1 Tax=Leptolyngbya sp. FACHB-671 TaxID=2692812 RepID=UPI0018EF853F|nr:glycosyltransferase family 2 protein [Leptolyngbya sp. FACHB-671]